MSNTDQRFQSIAQIVAERVQLQPEQVAFSFLRYRGKSDAPERVDLSSRALHERALGIAAQIAVHCRRGDRALLVFRPGLDFVCSFVACLYAGVIAVPVPAPRQRFGIDRLDAAIKDCDAQLVLSTASVAEAAQAHLESAPRWHHVDQDGQDRVPDFTPVSAAATDVAFLQYSSGSTGDPKGVMVSHGNLIAHARQLVSAFSIAESDAFVTWLPHFHDMGLITALVVPLVRGNHSVMMAPDSFIQQPVRWLRALTEFRCRHSTAPDFAYELCARRVSDEEMQGLDLSGLDRATTGAEPVRAQTIEAFSKRFAGVGFRPDSFSPTYGLAEATLVVTTQDNPRVVEFDSAGLDQRVVELAADGCDAPLTLVSCGKPIAGTEVRIVDPETGIEQPERQIGEICISGPSVAQGYWGKAADSDAFALSVGSESNRYFKSGDLGFMHDGELFVRGRIKDLILIRGANHHAVDLEQAALASHPLLAEGFAAAYSVDDGSSEQLQLLVELPRGTRSVDGRTLQAITNAVLEAMQSAFQLVPHSVGIVVRAIPRTSSGKVRRAECRKRFLAGRIQCLHLWRADQVGGAADKAADRTADSAGDVEHLIKFLRAAFAARLNLDPQAVRSSADLVELGAHAQLRADVARQVQIAFGSNVTQDQFLEHRNIDELARYLADSGMAAVEPGKARSYLPAEELAGGERRASAIDEPIAIVGMACRFPGAANVDEFWGNLCAGVDAVTEVPAERWDCDALYDENPLAMGKMNTRRGGFLKDIEYFDRTFFNISMREAVRMDPAHRLLLEVSWEAFEDAAIRPSAVDGKRVGVFVGISGSDYAQLQFGDDSLSDAYAGVGCALTNAASRISHFMNFTGPALAVDTACSSSLTSLHLACQSVRSGDCEMALAGGVNIVLAPSISMSLSKAGMMAPDGRCKAFDSAADGYVRSEGVGLVVIKPLSHAIRDGDPIHAVIRGSASNQDGRSSVISAPNGAAQQRVVIAACENAGIQPGQLDYVEAHGTGTPVGDPIEVNALGEVLKLGRKHAGEFPIGSVKTAIGHAEAAAGIASIIKASLVAKNRSIPPSLNFNEPNPQIDFDGLGIRVQTEFLRVPERPEPLLVGVNSFGIGGTNVHFVLQEYKEDASRDPQSAVAQPAASTPELPLVLSAKTDSALRELAARTASHLLDHGHNCPLPDLSYTLAQRRERLPRGLSVVAGSAAEAASCLNTFAEGGYHADLRAHRSRTTGSSKVAFVFSGQGSQWWAMGRELLAVEPVFAAAMQRCDELLGKHSDWSLLEVMGADEQSSQLDQTVYAQPALFAIQYSLCELLRDWGVQAEAVLGHSLGEIAAACVSGALALSDACRLVAIRGRLMQAETGRGMMVSVELERAATATLIAPWSERVSIAATNGPATTVISGDTAAVEEILSELSRRGIDALPLPVNYAFHCHQLDHARSELVAALAELPVQRPQLRFMSSVDGCWRDGQPLDADYWGRNMREEVRFADAIAALKDDGFEVLVEISPAPVLSGLIRRIGGDTLQAIHTLERGIGDRRALLNALCALNFGAVEVDWAKVCQSDQVLGGLCSYPWERERCWMDAPHHEMRRRMGTHPLVSTRMPTATPAWTSNLDPHLHPYVAGVRLGQRQRLCNGLLVELALEASASVAKGTQLVELALSSAVQLPLSGKLPLLQTTVELGAERAVGCRVHCQTDDSQGKTEGWESALSCRLVPVAASSAEGPESFDVELLQSRLGTEIAAADLYRTLAQGGVEYESNCQTATRLWSAADAALVALREGLVDADKLGRYHLHPLHFEAMEQAARVACGSKAAHGILAGIRRIRLFDNDTATAAYVYARARSAESSSAGSAGARSVCDAWLLSADGQLLASLEGVQIDHVLRPGSEAANASDAAEAWNHIQCWEGSELAAAKRIANGRWLIVDCGAPQAAALADKLRAEQQQVLYFDAAQSVAANSLNEDLRGRLKDAQFKEQDCSGVILYAPAAERQIDAPGASSFLVNAEADSEPPSGSAWSTPAWVLIDVVKAVTQSELLAPPRLWVVTRGAQSVGAESVPCDPAGAMLWGAARSVAIEHAELRVSRFDGDPEHSAGETEALVAELLADGAVDQLAWRASARQVLRLAHAPAGDTSSDSTRYRWEESASEPTLSASRWPRPRLQPNQVELELGLAELAAAQQGAEVHSIQTVGIVRRVGADVSNLVVGQQAYSLTAATLGRHAVLDAELVYPWSEGMTTASALVAARPAAQTLVALRAMGGAQDGSRVLIRSSRLVEASVAAQVARSHGAKVYLQVPAALHAALADLRVEAVFDESAATTAVLGMRSLLGGKAVDAVLNFAEQLENSDCILHLKPFGRVINFAVGQARSGHIDYGRLPANIALHGIDFDDHVRANAEEAAELAAQVVGLLSSSRIRLPQIAEWGIDQSLSRPTAAGDDGTQVLRLAELAAEDQMPLRMPYRDDEVYLISGGLGGLGLKLAERIVVDGGRKLALLGRSPPSLPALDKIAALEQRGAQVCTYALDVADRDSLRDCLTRIRINQGRIGGVVHAAGVLQNALATSMTHEEYAKVMPSKVDGAINLDLLTGEDGLRFFVMFSSLASIIGSPGQANYAAGNAFLEALARDRQRRGMPGLAIAWGPWAEAGMAAGELNLMRLEQHGIGMISMQRGLDVVGELISSQRQGVIGVLPMNWAVWGKSFPYFATTSYFGELIPKIRDGGVSGRLSADLIAHLPAEEQVACIRDAVLQSVAQAMRTDPENIDSGLPLAALGLDSIIALELKGRIESRIEIVIRTSSLISGRSIDELAQRLHEEMMHSVGADEAIADAEPGESLQGAEPDGGFEDLSKDEIEAMLKSLEPGAPVG